MGDIEKLTKQVKTLTSEVRELKAMISQLGPVEVKTTMKMVLESLDRQGLTVHEKIAYLKHRNKA